MKYVRIHVASRFDIIEGIDNDGLSGDEIIGTQLVVAHTHWTTENQISVSARGSAIAHLSTCRDVCWVHGSSHGQIRRQRRISVDSNAAYEIGIDDLDSISRCGHDR